MEMLQQTTTPADHLINLNQLLNDMTASFLSMEKAFSRFDAPTDDLKQTINHHGNNNNKKNIISTLDTLLDDLAISYSTLPKKHSQTLQPCSNSNNPKNTPVKPPRKFSFGSQSLKRRPRCSSDSKLMKGSSHNNSSNMLHSINEHSTLCRRLKNLEISTGITLEKHLEYIISKKMKTLNLSGCVYCMYSFYVSIRHNDICLVINELFIFYLL